MTNGRTGFVNALKCRQHFGFFCQNSPLKAFRRPSRLGHMDHYRATEEAEPLFCCLRSPTPGPPPFSSMNSTPAASRRDAPPSHLERSLKLQHPQARPAGLCRPRHLEAPARSFALHRTLGQHESAAACSAIRARPPASGVWSHFSALNSTATNNGVARNGMTARRRIG